ncbi:C6 finger domain-containing protein [Purpureocillium lilacinum]|uniref:C6 finger domain-containing protein n=2 Tax=Purpureocillium lilacinum TaxID=33203 RepID=A0A179HWA4_PURLI|nr:C6 finger domain-containing protein [Purpureocillium lilacinum]OAQ93831.1 C6 finger domain-containing protein [Purpureocillium lilacinum]GJN72227.1 hypothetical protein PLICBS_006299 [Purpureocillium lilacinum]GJN81904.1 hypothetical protein PLIIFM63780_005440 [Purpureocillium lilacinum]
MFGVYTLDEPADGVVRAPKLNCKKSRFGCTRCKLRRVKCNEQRPKCQHCRRHGTACVYKHDRAQAQAGHSSTQGSQRRQNAANNPDSLASRATEPDPAESRERRVLEAGLMRQYVAKTGPGTAIDDLTRPMFAEAIPEQSLGCDSLLYSMYSIAALHQACGARDGAAAAVSSDVHRRYLAMALREHQASLQDITADNVDNLCMTSSLLRVCAYAMLQTRPRVPYSPPSEWLLICGTAMALYEKAWDVAKERPDSLAWKFLRSPYAMADEGHSGEDKSTAFDILLTREAGDSDPWDVESQEAYQQALCFLGSVQCAIQDGEPEGHICRLLVVFPMVIKRRLFDLVNAEEPRALALLAHYFALLSGFDHMWWIGPGPAQEVMAIAEELSTHGRWVPVLRRPIEQVNAGSKAYGRTSSSAAG